MNPASIHVKPYGQHIPAELKEIKRHQKEQKNFFIENNRKIKVN